MSLTRQRIAIVGAGWAGLAAAVELCQAGHQVTVYEMAPQAGGRARSLQDDASPYRLDNGQHILIGAYSACLDLMRTLGLDLEQSFLRQPLRLRYPDHEGLRLPPGPPLLSFVRAILSYSAWPLKARLHLLGRASAWLMQGFRCAPQLNVDQLCAGLPGIVRQELLDPLCVAALNTPARQASAQVFLRVLQDALFSGRGSADLLLPKRGLSELLAEPAQRWLMTSGAQVLLGHRVQALKPVNGLWQIETASPALKASESFDQVILACSAAQAVKLVAPWAADWAQAAQALRFEPIITVYLHAPDCSLPAAMVALQEGPNAPAQFAFDLGLLGHAPGLFAFVISGAADWVERGLAEAGAAVLQQAQQALAWQSPPTVYRVLAEKRATFACTPDLQRPAMRVSSGLWAAGDYIAGPYPATLEGAVRAGKNAAQAACRHETG